MASRLSNLRQNTERPTMPAPPADRVERLAEAAEVKPLPKLEVIPSSTVKNRTPAKIAKLRTHLRPKLVSSPDEFDQMTTNNPEHRAIVENRLKKMLTHMNVQLNEQEFALLNGLIINDLLGFGAIEPLVQNRSFSEIMVNGPELIFVEHKGKLTESQVVFDDEEHLQWTAQRIVRPLQRDLSRRNPMVDARLPDGSRVHVVMPPAALAGTTITIRKFPEKALTWEDLVSFGSFTEDVANFLDACVKIRLNIVVSGGTGSGKTTLLNVMSGFIPEDERTITIEDSAELQLSQRHVVRLETAPPIPNSHEGQLTIRDLVKGALRMRPDRVVVGEIRDGAALDMLQAMNTGHDGSLTTVHSNSPRDAIARLETLTLMAGMDLPLMVIRAQIASAVNLIIQQARLKDGSRKVTQITEIQGMEGDNVILQPIFTYTTEDRPGMNPSHEGGGRLMATGMRPKFYDRFAEYGINLDPSTFGGNDIFRK